MGIFSSRRRKNKFKSSNPLLRWFGPGATSAGLLYGLYLLLSGGLSFSSLDGILGSADPAVSTRMEPIVLENLFDRPADGIRIATFNIENFSDNKSLVRKHESGVDVMGKIAEIVAAFDLVAIQEIRGKEGLAIQRLINLLNASGKTYGATISEPIGNEDRFESYAFVWDVSRIQFIPNSSYVVRDDGGRMYREPMVASFQTVVPPGSNQPPFRFTAINVHTDPDEVKPNAAINEIDVLADVFQRVREYEAKWNSEDDFILLGDLNVSTKQFRNLGQIQNVVSVAGDIQTNLNRTKTNDHILIDQVWTSEYSQHFGVIDLKEHLGLSDAQAKAISDHIPLWAEFSRFEASQPVVPEETPNANRRTKLIGFEQPVQ